MKKSFTLIELLVVVAIIAILAAILLPSLNKARERARTSSCVSNLKNIGIGSRMYSDEQKDWIVPLYNRSKYWYSILSAGYTGDYDVTDEDADKNIYSCPSADAPSFTGDSSTGFVGSHYAINNYVTGGIIDESLDIIANTDTEKYSKSLMRKSTAFKAPQSVKFVMDNHVFGKSHCYCYCQISYRHGAGDPRVEHSGSSTEATSASMAASALTNCLYLDGHVEGITYSDMLKVDGKTESFTTQKNLYYVYGKDKANHLYDLRNLAGVEIP